MNVVQKINANTPFLQGVPNSMVSKEWYRVLASLIGVFSGGSNSVDLSSFQAESETDRHPFSSTLDRSDALERLERVEIQFGRFNAALQNYIERRENDLECLLVMHRPQPLPASPFVSASAFIDGEIPFGVIDGANAIFTLANTPIAGSVHLYLNGVRQRLTTDYSISGVTITYTAGAKPKSGDNHYADYRQ